MDDLLDKIKEIKELALDTDGVNSWDDDNLNEIYNICDNILINHQINQRLKNETRHPEPDSLS